MNNNNAFSHKPVYANYALSLLLTAYILSFIDRQVLSLLVGPIRSEFQISDFEFSLLHGFAFAIFYTFMGLPIGRLVDQHNRRNIISIGVFFWSIMTCLCGFATNFMQLLLARIGVGVGEASLSPAAYSIISDYFPPEKLARALSIYAMGITLGGGLAYIIGGMVFEYFSQHPDFSFPLIGKLSAWQSTFITVGAPGFIITALLMTIREPRRQNLISTHSGNTPSALPIKVIVQYIKDNRRAYGSLILGTSMMSIIGYGSMAWYPEFLLRSHGMDKAQSGTQFGTIFIIAGTLGTFCGAWFTEQLRNRGHADAELRLIMLLAIGASLPALTAPLMPNAQLALLMTIPMLFLHYAHFGVAIAALQLITPNQMRGQISAVMLFMTNILGLAFGSSIVAFFTDYIFADDGSLNLSIATVSIVFYPLAAILYFSGLTAYRKMVSVTLAPGSRIETTTLENR